MRKFKQLPSVTVAISTTKTIASMIPNPGLDVRAIKLRITVAGAGSAYLQSAFEVGATVGIPMSAGTLTTEVYGVDDLGQIVTSGTATALVTPFVSYD